MRFGVAIGVTNPADLSRVVAGEWSRPALGPPDHELWEEAIRFADLAEALGFDSLWSAEHHVSPYVMTPNNLEWFAFVAGRTKRIDFGTMVIVLPWHHPLRVAEEIGLLDALAGGRRLQIGFGRGLGRREFEALGVDQNTARGRFIEGVEIIQLALTQPSFEYHGEFYDIPKTSSRPRPRDGQRLVNDMLGTFLTPPSMEMIAGLGLSPLFTGNTPIPNVAELVPKVNAMRATKGLPATQPVILCQVYCTNAPDKDRNEVGDNWQEQARSALLHYGFNDVEGLAKIKGYEHYASSQASSPDGLVGASGASTAPEEQIYGTPEQCIERIRELQEKTSCREIIGGFHAGSMDPEKARTSMEMFAAEVLPAVHDMATPMHDHAMASESLGA